MPSCLALFSLGLLSTAGSSRAQHDDFKGSFCDGKDSWDPLEIGLREVLCTAGFQSAMQAEMRNDCSTMLIDLMNPASFCKLLDGKRMKIYYPAMKAYVEAEVSIGDASDCERRNHDLRTRLYSRKTNRLSLNSEEIHKYDTAVKEGYEMAMKENTKAIAEWRDKIIERRDSLHLNGPSNNTIDKYVDAYNHMRDTELRAQSQALSIDSGDTDAISKKDTAKKEYLAIRDDLYAGCFPKERSGAISSLDIFGGKLEFEIGTLLEQYAELLGLFLQETTVLTEVLVPDEGPGMLSELLLTFKLPVKVLSLEPACGGKVARGAGAFSRWLQKKSGHLAEMTADIQGLEKRSCGMPDCRTPKTPPNGFLPGCQVCDIEAKKPNASLAAKAYGTLARGAAKVGRGIAGFFAGYVSTDAHLQLIRFLTQPKPGGAHGNDASPLTKIFSKNGYEILGNLMTPELLTKVLGGLMLDMGPSDVKALGKMKVPDPAVRVLRDTAMYVQCVKAKEVGN